MILFKYPDKQREFQYLDERVQKIVYYMEKLAMCRWREPLVVTCVHRLDPDSPHYYYRAIDIACLVRGNNETLRDHLNEVFPYGKDGYDTVPPLNHKGSTQTHYHLQCKAKE